MRCNEFYVVTVYVVSNLCKGKMDYVKLGAGIVNM